LGDFTKEFSKNFSSDDILVCDSNWLATPLHYIYGLNTLQISDQHNEKAIPKCARAADLMAEWVRQGKNVFYITHRDEIYLPTLDLIKVKESSFESVKMKQSRKHIPRGFDSYSPTVKIYKAVKISSSETPPKNKYVINIGDYAFGLVDGFYRSEQMDGQDVRWTRDSARAIIPWFSGEQDMILTIRMSGARPENIPDAEADIFIEDVLIDHFRLHNSFEDYVCRIPAGKIPGTEKQRVIVEIISTTWNPNTAGVSGDNRNLGVVIDRIIIERAVKP
jgi:hypothetical protein